MIIKSRACTPQRHAPFRPMSSLLPGALMRSPLLHVTEDRGLAVLKTYNPTSLTCADAQYSGSMDIHSARSIRACCLRCPVPRRQRCWRWRSAPEIGVLAVAATARRHRLAGRHGECPSSKSWSARCMGSSPETRGLSPLLGCSGSSGKVRNLGRVPARHSPDCCEPQPRAQGRCGSAGGSAFRGGREAGVCVARPT